MLNGHVRLGVGRLCVVALSTTWFERSTDDGHEGGCKYEWWNTHCSLTVCLRLSSLNLGVRFLSFHPSC